MGKISALDFANNVERNRKKLIQHCLKHGKEVSENETLDVVIAVNDEIDGSTLDGYFNVEFKDLNGDYFAPTQYVKAGESAVIPNGYPELEPDILEFVEWECSGDLNNVQEDLICLPRYQTKVNDVVNQRPTILICYFDENTLSPKINIGTGTNLYVNWGDGSPAELVTQQKVPHTYEHSGLYTIVLYGEKYSIKGENAAGLFSTADYCNCLYKAYLGENCTAISTYAFRNNASLDTVICSFDSKVTSLGGCFSGCKSLRKVVLPKKGLTSIGQNTFSGCVSLKNLTIPDTVTSIGQSAFSECASLQSINLPSSMTSYGSSAFASCTSLRSITLPKGLVVSSSIWYDCQGLSKINIPQDYDGALYTSPAILDESCLVDIANKIKDNTGLTTRTLTLNTLNKVVMTFIYLDQYGNRVPHDTDGAVSLLEFIRNKNWTVSFV